MAARDVREVPGPPPVGGAAGCATEARTAGGSEAILRPPGLTEARLDRNVVYGMYSGLALLMDVRHPENPNGLGIVFIGGSGWQSAEGWDAVGLKDKESQTGAWIPPLLRAGYTVFAVNHRAAPRFRYPAALEDVRRAIRFVRAHAGDFGIDGDRIGAVAGSSGAHLACLAALTAAAADAGPAEAAAPTASGVGADRGAANATAGAPPGAVNTMAGAVPALPGTPPSGAAPAGAAPEAGISGSRQAIDPVDAQSSALQCLVLREPPTDLAGMATEGDDEGKGYVIDFMGTAPESPGAAARLYSEASPVSRVSPSAPPILMIHGDADGTVPYRHSVAMEAALRAAGCTASLLTIPGGAHSPDFGAEGRPRPDWPDYIGAMVAWLDTHLGAPGAQRK